MKHELVQAASATDILLTEGVVLLGVALAFVILFRRLGLGAVLGSLIAGALVGQQGLGLVGGADSKLAIAEIGIVLLLFLVGLELKPQRLWRLKRAIFALGFLEVALARKSVVEGKSVTVRVDLGGRRIIQKKKRDSEQLE